MLEDDAIVWTEPKDEFVTLFHHNRHCIILLTKANGYFCQNH